jgi:hypothetical protein
MYTKRSESTHSRVRLFFFSQKKELDYFICILGVNKNKNKNKKFDVVFNRPSTMKSYHLNPWVL